MLNLNFISAEIFISLSIMFLLILGVFKKNSSNLIHYLSVGFLLITGTLILNNPLDSNISLFNNSVIERLWIKLELFFLKTPKVNKNIIDKEIKISGEIKFKLFITFSPQDQTYLS